VSVPVAAATPQTDQLPRSATFLERATGGVPSDLTPLLSDLVVNAVPLDLVSLERGLQQFLQQLDQFGRQVTDWEQHGLSSWVFAAAVTAIACEVARRALQPCATEPEQKRGSGPWTWSAL